MGNKESYNKESYFMNIKIIGSNITNFYEKIKKTQNTIKKLWNFEPLEENKEIKEQLKHYFGKLEKNLEIDSININIREVLILKIDNIFDPEVSLVIELMDKLDEVQYMPLVLLLCSGEFDQQLNIDTNNYKQIDPRLIFINRYSEDSEIIKNEIDPILFRFCSIHNDLGDRFKIGNEENNNVNNFDLVDKYFLFNINIACIGRFRQGKSTGVNKICGEYKAKESSKGCSQTKNLTYYHVRGKPIRVLDIPGFEDEKTVEETVKKLRECGKEINRLKENLHIILYFLNFADKGTFMNLESQILKEIIKFKKSKIIYVITHSKPNLSDNIKKRKIRNINQGIQNIKETNNIKENFGMLEATDNNTVFVNFHKDYESNIEPFGTKELFKKIYEFFIKSDDFIKSFNNFEPDVIEKNAMKLRKEGQDILRFHKISGGLIGLIPVVDMVVQKYVIKKNAIKKVGELFGFTIESIDQELIIQDKTLEKELAEGTTKEKIGNGIKATSGTGGCIGGGISIGSGVAEAANATKMAAEATKMTSQGAKLGVEAAKMGTKAIEVGANAAKMGEEAAKMGAKAIEIGANAAKMGEEAAKMGAKAIEDWANAAKMGKEASRLAEVATEMTPWYTNVFGITSKTSIEASNIATKAANMASESVNLNVIATNMSTKAASMASESVNLNTIAANFTTKAANMASESVNLNTIAANFSTKAASMASESASLNAMGTNLASNAASTLSKANYLKYIGTGITISSFILGAGLGFYFTHKFCEELLDKFVNLYKKCPQRICNSYRDAAYYFYSMSK